MSAGKQISIVLLASLAMAGVIVSAFVFDPLFIFSAYHILSMVIVTLWGFFSIPAAMLGFWSARTYMNRHSDAEAMRTSFRMGVCLGFGGSVVLFVVIAPVAGIGWYFLMAREAALEHRNKKRAKDAATDPFAL